MCIACIAGQPDFQATRWNMFGSKCLTVVTASEYTVLQTPPRAHSRTQARTRKRTHTCGHAPTRKQDTRNKPKATEDTGQQQKTGMAARTDTHTHTHARTHTHMHIHTQMHARTQSHHRSRKALCGSFAQTSKALRRRLPKQALLLCALAVRLAIWPAGHDLPGSPQPTMPPLRVRAAPPPGQANRKSAEDGSGARVGSPKGGLDQRLVLNILRIEGRHVWRIEGHLVCVHGGSALVAGVRGIGAANAYIEGGEPMTQSASEHVSWPQSHAKYEAHWLLLCCKVTLHCPRVASPRLQHCA